MSEHAIMVVAAHPDDETFGCGGTLALHVMNGHRAHIVSLTCSEGKRKDELTKASRALGAERPSIFDEVELEFNSQVVHRLSDIVAEKRPEIMFTHIPWDYHREHRASYKIVKEAMEWASHTTTYDDAWRVRRLLLMEVNTMIPTPHVLVDISDVFNKKMKAIECYPTQLAKFPDGYYRNFNRAKAVLRGVQGGCSHAEAFFEESLPKNGPFYRTKSTKSLFD